MNSLPLPPLPSFTKLVPRVFVPLDQRYLHALRNTVTLNSYLGLFARYNYFWFTYNTVGYPRENERWPLNRVWFTLNRVINFLVNMESIQDNHDRRAFELSLVTFNFRLYLPSPFPKQSF